MTSSWTRGTDHAHQPRESRSPRLRSHPGVKTSLETHLLDVSNSHCYRHEREVVPMATSVRNNAAGRSRHQCQTSASSKTEHRARTGCGHPGQQVINQMKHSLDLNARVTNRAAGECERRHRGRQQSSISARDAARRLNDIARQRLSFTSTYSVGGSQPPRTASPRRRRCREGRFAPWRCVCVLTGHTTNVLPRRTLPIAFDAVWPTQWPRRSCQRPPTQGSPHAMRAGISMPGAVQPAGVTPRRSCA